MYQRQCNTLMSTLFDADYWHKYYRMGNETFEYLCKTVTNFMNKQCTNKTETILVSKRVGIALWWICSN